MSRFAFWPPAPNRYEVDLSNEVLCTLVDQEAAKILEVEVGGRKKGSTRPHRVPKCISTLNISTRGETPFLGQDLSLD